MKRKPNELNNQPIAEYNKKKKQREISLSLAEIKDLIKKAEKNWPSFTNRKPRTEMQRLLKIIIASDLNSTDRSQLLVQTLNLIPLFNKGNDNSAKKVIRVFFGLQKNLFSESLFYYALVRQDFESFSCLYTKLIKSYNTPTEFHPIQEQTLSDLIKEKDKALHEYYELCKAESERTFRTAIPLTDGIIESEAVESESSDELELKKNVRQETNNPTTEKTQDQQPAQFRLNEGVPPELKGFFGEIFMRDGNELTNLNNVTDNKEPIQNNQPAQLPLADNNAPHQQDQVFTTANPSLSERKLPDNKAPIISENERIQNFQPPRLPLVWNNQQRQRQRRRPITTANPSLPERTFAYHNAPIIPVNIQNNPLAPPQQNLLHFQRRHEDNKAPINLENAQIQNPLRGQLPITGNHPGLAGLFGQNLPQGNPAQASQQKKHFDIPDTQKFIADPQNTHRSVIHMSVAKTINDLLTNISSEKSENTEEKLTMIQALEKENLEIFNYYWAILELKVKNESHNIFGSSSNNQEAPKIAKTLMKILTSIKSQVIPREYQPQIVFEREEKLISSWKEYVVAREIYFLLNSLKSESYLCPNTSLSAREAVVLLWSALKQTQFLKFNPPETAEEYRDHLLKVNLFDGLCEASQSPCMDGKVNAVVSSLNGSHLLIQVEYINADNIPEMIKTQYNQNYKTLSASERNLLIKDVFKTLLRGKGSLTILLAHPGLYKNFHSYIVQFLSLKAFSPAQVTDCFKEFGKSSASYIDQFPEFHSDCLKAIENIDIGSALISNSLFTQKTKTTSESSTSSCSDSHRA